MLHGKSSITPVKLPGPLLGVALIGPWGEFRTTAPAYTRNAFKDTEDAYALSKWAAYYLGNAEPDPYNQPFRTSAAWWENLNSVVQNIIITAGTDEVFVDDIEAFARQIKVCINALKFGGCLRVEINHIYAEYPAREDCRCFWRR